MRLAIAAVALLAVAASRGSCGSGGSGSGSGHDPCAGKACGSACTACAPDDPRCVETAVVKACDSTGRCVPATPELACPDPCLGRSCGESCVWDPPCRSATPPCAMPSQVGHCGADGGCVPGAFAGCDPDPECAGKVCGESCDRCGGACTYPAATACDYAGRCAWSTPWLCYDPCAGKACGAQCHACPPDASGCAEPAVLMACYPDGVCRAWTSDLACP